VRVFSLGFHADYRCAHSGVCCSSGWEIPVTPEAEERIQAAVAAGRLEIESRGVPLFRSRRELPDGANVVFGLDPGGRCAFFEPQARLCAIHRQAGAAALPPSCRQFPRVVLLTPAGVFITLSHYCPTAAAMLFREDAADTIVGDPPAFPEDEAWEGLDAREAWPPLLRPGVLLGWDGFVLWQQEAVRLLLRQDLSVEVAVAALSARSERAADWTAADGALLEGLRGAASRVEHPSVIPFSFATAMEAWNNVAGTIPERLRRSPSPLGPGPAPEPGWEAAHARLVMPAWPGFAAPVRRFLAAKAFASWTALQGEGLVAWSRTVETALAVLHVEATRQCLDAPLDRAALLEAFRHADLLLMHLSQP